MKSKIATFYILMLLFSADLFALDNTKYSKTKTRIVIEGLVSTEIKSVKLIFKDQLTFNSETSKKNQYPEEEISVRNGFCKFAMDSNKPLEIIINDLAGTSRVFLFEPGDSIRIINQNGKVSFNGRGISIFMNEIDRQMNELSKPANTSNVMKSLQEYLEYHAWAKKKTNLVIGMLKTRQSQISSYAYNFIKFNYIVNIENKRAILFTIFNRKAILSENDRCAVYDTTILHTSTAAYLRNIPIPIDRSAYFQNFAFSSALTDCWNEFNGGVEMRNATLAQRRVAFYNTLKRLYSGYSFHAAVLMIFPEQYFKELGFTPEMEQILADYYSIPGYDEYKKIIKRHEIEMRDYHNARRAVNFSLIDTSGKSFTLESLNGKLSVVKFYDGNRILMKEDDVIKLFLKEPKLQNIAVDISANKGEEFKIFAKNYNLTSYPVLLIFNANSQLIYNSLTYPFDNLKDNIDLSLSIMKDGPYVEYGGGKRVAYNTDGREVKMQDLSTGMEKQLLVTTDQNTFFELTLKKQMQNEASTYTRPEKIFILSDIEGEFGAFRRLLQANKVVSKEMNWIFGSGHLVFAGDMFDRGKQVTECLWFIYMLEEQAKKAGGYVHFVLGNHEIMNLQGDHRYVDNKYKDNSSMIGKTLLQFYNEDSELGRWLRTKNIVEKIGDLLVMHGGISPEVISLSINVDDMNSIARPFYDQKKYNGNRVAAVLHSGEHSPFWYRGYYGKYKIANFKSVVDSTLQKFNVKHLITGHTVIADTISSFYNGKVINTDTKHRVGNSEALLIEGTHFYRVNAEGIRILLFKEEEK